MTVDQTSPFPPNPPEPRSPWRVTGGEPDRLPGESADAAEWRPLTAPAPGQAAWPRVYPGL